jgi:hypothetical protein
MHLEQWTARGPDHLRYRCGSVRALLLWSARGAPPVANIKIFATAKDKDNIYKNQK